AIDPIATRMNVPSASAISLRVSTMPPPIPCPPATPASYRAVAGGPKQDRVAGRPAENLDELEAIDRGDDGGLEHEDWRFPCLGQAAVDGPGQDPDGDRAVPLQDHGHRSGLRGGE